MASANDNIIFIQPFSNMSDRFVLSKKSGVLTLTDKELPKVKPIYVDFLALENSLKHQKGIGKNQLIAKALGIKGPGLRVLDVTLGLGKDAFFMTFLGCKVVGIERAPEIFALVNDALERKPELKSMLEIKLTDAKSMLATLKDDLPDVIYIDPMYPETHSTAAPRAEMQIMRNLLGATEDFAEVFSLALRKARQRVVVKRPPQAQILPGPLINSYEGKAVRYDAYSGLGS